MKGPFIKQLIGIKNCIGRERKGMGFLSHRVQKSDLKSGDHIYTWRAGFIYSHHGIYAGEGKVVHFTQQWNLSSSSHSSSTSSRSASLDFPDCGCSEPRTGVVMSCLDCFMGNGSLYRFEYGVSREAFFAKLRSGTCTTAKSDPTEDVMHRAMYLLYNGFGKYDLFRNNCEDFALYCKTEYVVCGQKEARGGSGQASSALSLPVAVVLSLPLLGLIPSPVVIGAMAVATHAFTKYAADVGVRNDVEKVRVEE